MLLKLGTRKSALALAQSQWVADRLQALDSNLSVELVGIETRADESRGGALATTPLQQLDGQNFFVQELDDALTSKRTDISVHSYKDLSLERPSEIQLGAIPPREDARDVVILSTKGKTKLKRGKLLLLGTASPRRAHNVPELLHKEFGVDIQVEPLRGNITTRISRLKDIGDRYLDGVVLAVAGIKRLYQSPGYRQQLVPKLQQLFFLPLPLAMNPTAPGQGALAVECRKEDTHLQHMLQQIHCTRTEMSVKQERDVLARYGGGCHQAFGASSIYTGSRQKSALYVRGLTPYGEILNEVHGNPEPDAETLQLYSDIEKLVSS